MAIRRFKVRKPFFTVRLSTIVAPTKSWLPKLFAFAVFLTSPSSPVHAAAPPTPGKVFLVIGSDTAVWNVAGGVNTAVYHNHFLPDLYIQPQMNGYQVMNPAFRNRFVDSYGQTVKLTWWMLVGSVYGLADNTDIPIPNQMPLYLMQKYHGDAMRQYGDEVSIHYHTFFWSDYNGDGKFYWNEAHTFHECRADFDFTLAQSLLEHEVFPASFRSGWHYMDNEWQSYLNLLLPFSLDNDSPNLGLDTVEPLENVLDWSKATTAFVPFHPSTTNYQLAGDGVGWNVRSVKMPNVTQGMMNGMFAAAAMGTNQVACLWAHLPETAFLTNIASMDAFAHAASAKYTNVQFRYCTAVEAMQRWLGTVDQTPPQLTVTPSAQGEVVTLAITADEPLWQPQPFVAVKDICNQCRIVPCYSNGPSSWTAALPVPRSELAKLGVAITDLAGNVTTRVIRYLQDDIFVDNLDPEYTELSGNWTTATNAPWGIDARIASLGTGDLAQAQWSLPVTNSGLYELYVQVPKITNAAGNVVYNLYSGGSNILSTFFAAPPPPRQWIYLGVGFLDATLTNVIAMAVSGSNQPNTFAIADVVKATPLIPQQGLVSAIQIDPASTTANLTWISRVPTSTLVEYGPDLNYVGFSPTNSLLTTNHVTTLAGLQPNTLYYFQIDAAAGIAPCTAQASFSTLPAAPTTQSAPMFALTNAWKYTTNNLDGINWKAPGYNDGNWASGPGVFWVDTKYPTNGNADIQFLPLHTQMPTNRATAHPFISYYFRTHFMWTNTIAGGALVFTNYIDDGAAFYINGTEVNRAFLTNGAVNAAYATSFNCSSGDATCPYVFSLSGDALTNLAYGDNVLAVEVHNNNSSSPDVTFGCALSLSLPFTPTPQLKLLRSGTGLTLYWNGAGTLQQARQLDSSAGWSDVTGPVANSPYPISDLTADSQPRFYRLRSP